MLLKTISILTFLLSLSHPITSLTINCRYNEWDWNFQKHAYECIGSHVHPEDTLPHITNFTGIHMGGGNHTEVQAMRVMHQSTITFVPTGIAKFFPNLRGLSFMNCNVKIVTKEHLQDFPEMLQIAFNLNRIEVLPSNLFEGTPKLQLVNFAGNNIKHIGAGLFKPLKNLDYIWLEKNVCINQNSRGKELKKLKKEIRKSCRMGGKVDCKKIPKAFRIEEEMQIVNTCDVVLVYKFKPKPRHELIRLQREKEEEEAKKQEDYINNVLKICEADSPLARYVEVMLIAPGQEGGAQTLDWQKGNIDKDAGKIKENYGEII